VIQAAYWVLADGVPRGPYGLAALIELARRGALSAETPVRIDGEEEWVRAEEIAALRSIVAGAAPSAAVGAVAAPRRRVPRWILGVAIGACGGGLIAGAVAVALPMLGGSPLVSEAILEEGMPSQVQSLIVFRAPSEPSESDRVLAGSSMAGFCGGTDVGDELLDARGATPAELERRGVLGLLQRPGVREELACGARIAAAAGAFKMVLVSFEDGEETRSVALLSLGELAEPPFPQRHNFSGLDGRCHPAEEGSAECAADEHALVRRGDEWAFGDAGDVAAYAREWNRGAERSETTHMEYARLLGRALDEDAVITPVQIRPEALPLDGMCGQVPGGVEECLPDDAGDSVTRILARIRGVSAEVRAPTHAIMSPALRWRMTFAARDEEDASDVARELEALVQDWRAHLENNESAYIERIRESEARDVDRQEAMLRGFLRAMAEAEVEADGRLARLVAEAELSDAEQREVRTYLTTVREEREAAARVVTATQAGEAPARTDLARLVGDEAAGWMLEPRASAASCAQIAERLTQLAAGGVATADFGAHFRLQQRLGEDRCRGTVMPAATLACLTGATSIAAMERCPPALPPWERQPIDHAAQGELSDGDARLARLDAPYDEHTVEVDAGWIISAELETTAFEPSLWLLGPDGSLVTFGDARDPRRRVEHTAAANGTYTLRAGSFDAGARGPYTLRMTARPGAL
jgi:hypothetical protein